MKEKLTIILGIGITLAVITTFAYYILLNPTIELFDLIALPIVFIILLTTIYVIYDKYKNIKAGLPTQDERLLL